MKELNINFSNFSAFLRECRLYYDDKELGLIFSALAQNVPVMLKGIAGVGKTAITKAVADYLNANYNFFQCTLGTSEEDLIFKLIPDSHTKSGIKVVEGVLPEALELSKTGKVVLVLDEFDKTRPTADALLLDFLQNWRISSRFDGKKTIEGNGKNIYVFLTSNEVREFSEPLLRRVAVVKLPSLSRSNVLRVLKENGVPEELQSILVKLYEDTLNAGLNKPATVQELVQLANAVKILGNSADFTSLVRSYVIKDDYDYQKLTSYLSSSSEEEENESSSSNEDISSFYEDADSFSSSDKNEEAFVPKMPRVKKIEHENVQLPPVSEEEEVCGVLENKDSWGLTGIVKTLNPPISNSPTTIGEFEIKSDIIIKKNPMSLEEVYRLRYEIVSFYAREDISHLDIDAFVKYLTSASNKISSWHRGEIAGSCDGIKWKISHSGPASSSSTFIEVEGEKLQYETERDFIRNLFEKVI